MNELSSHHSPGPRLSAWIVIVMLAMIVVPAADYPGDGFARQRNSRWRIPIRPRTAIPGARCSFSFQPRSSPSDFCRAQRLNFRD
jgi:hypothetical protein